MDVNDHEHLPYKTGCSHIGKCHWKTYLTAYSRVKWKGFCFIYDTQQNSCADVCYDLTFLTDVLCMQNRPSVITCAPANNRNCNLSHCTVSHNGCSPSNYRRPSNCECTNTFIIFLAWWHISTSYRHLGDIIRFWKFMECCFHPGILC